MSKLPKSRLRVGIVLLGLLPSSLWASAQNTAATIKAATIYKLAQFTTWRQAIPEGVPLEVCVFGTDAIVTELRRLDGNLIQGCAVRAVNPPLGHPLDCKLAYLAASERDLWGQTLPQLVANGVLPVIDGGEALEDFGAGIVLAIENERVVFAINLKTVHGVGAKIAAQALRIARRVTLR